MSTPTVFIEVADIVAQLNATGPDNNNNYTVYGLTLAQASIQAHVDYANSYISALTASPLTTTDPRYPMAVQAAKDLACIRVLVVSMGGSITGAFDYFLGDLRVSRAGPYATAIKNTIQGFEEDLKRMLVNVATVAAAADAQQASNVPTYRGGLISP